MLSTVLRTCCERAASAGTKPSTAKALVATMAYQAGVKPPLAGVRSEAAVERDKQWPAAAARANAASAAHATHPSIPQPPVESWRQPRGLLTVSELGKLAESEAVETVIVGFTDIYGRFLGKRMDARYFVARCAESGTHACAYLFTCDMAMNPVDGFAFANWKRGFGDMHLVPDLSTLRVCSWLDKTAMVICDVHGSDHQLTSISPRSILKRQLERAAELGFGVDVATEMEFYLYETTYREARDALYSRVLLKPTSAYIEDYHILQGTREERFNGSFRRHLSRSGVPVECSKSEAGIGQQELNVIYTDALSMADRHVVYKMCLKDVAEKEGGSVTFMAKPFTEDTGSGCHIHINLTKRVDAVEATSSAKPAVYTNAFAGDIPIAPSHEVTSSQTFRHFMGGALKYTPDIMPLYAPTINSYKRFRGQSWAPTRLAWALDNRTAGFRVVGDAKSVRVEIRVPGSDVNPYLAIAGAISTGMQGVKEKLEPPALFEGDVYEAKQLPQVTHSLDESISNMGNSKFSREALGDDVVDHLTRFYQMEVDEYRKHVSDWERSRYFEQI